MCEVLWWVLAHARAYAFVEGPFAAVDHVDLQVRAEVREQLLELRGTHAVGAIQLPIAAREVKACRIDRTVGRAPTACRELDGLVDVGHAHELGECRRHFCIVALFGGLPVAGIVAAPGHAPRLGTPLVPRRLGGRTDRTR